MKVLIVSDIHGGYKYLKMLLEQVNDFDKMLILGDILSSSYSDFHDELVCLLNSYSDKIIAVRGNCDGSNIDELDFLVEDDYFKYILDKKLVFMTHGNKYNKTNLPNIDFDIFLSGHTHIPEITRINNKLFINPGSLTLPRGMSNNSYIVYQDGVFYLMDLINNKEIKKEII